MGNTFMLYLAIFIFMTNTATGEDQPQHATGLTNGFVDLLINKNDFLSVKEEYWKVTRGPKTYRIAQFKDNNLVGYDSFKNRLEILRGGMGLRIRNLTLEDNGIYCAAITLEDNTLPYKCFNVTVYEPVPEPTIRTSYKKGKGNERNFILHCSVPKNTTSLSYTWKYRHKGSAYQLYNGTSDTIRMSLQPENLDMEVQCIVQNLADSKHVTVKLEPVPAPTITIDCEKENKYITLHCSVPVNTTSLSYTWKYRYPGANYQLLNSTDDTIRMSLQPENLNMEVQCIVQNLADSKNASITLGLCYSRERWPAYLALAVFGFIVLICVIYSSVTRTKQPPTPCVKYSKSCTDDNVKISIMETNPTVSLGEKYPTQEEPFPVPEDAVKYSDRDFITLHAKKLEESNDST